MKQHRNRSKRRKLTLGGRRLQTAELRKQVEFLEELVAERTSNLEVVSSELASFSYSVSHDLRAPLRSIIGFSRALMEDQGESLDDKGMDYLRRMHAAGQRMEDLIDNLLRLSRITRQAMTPGAVDLSGLAREIVGELRAAAPNRRAEIAVADGLTAVADPSLLRVMLENLLGNAWKFTSHEENAVIEVGADDIDGRTTFFVRDNGVGFDMKAAGKLFGAFQRMHRADAYEGAGIGLATVQRIIHRHGGRVWAHAEVGEGATFFFTVS